MTHNFYWKQVPGRLFRPRAIEIYSGETLAGIIPDESLKKAAEINGKRFLMSTRHALSFPKNYILTDPDSGKTWCKIEERMNRDIFATINGKLYNIGVYPDDNPSQSNGLIMQGYNDQLFSYSSGRLEIRTREHIEILTACYFFVCYLRHCNSILSL